MFVVKQKFAPGGRTSKSDHGAKRRSIIMTVLASLNTRFPKFTLDHLLFIVKRWINDGCSLFHLELEGLKKARRTPSYLKYFH